MIQDPPTGAIGPAAEGPTGETAAARPRRRRRWLRGIVRAAALFLSLVVAILAIAVIATLSIDLGPAAKGHAERAAANYLGREFSIGRLSIRLATGTFLVEDLVIGGLEPEHRPFLTARTIEVGMPLGALFRREVLLESIVMSDWNMLIETWPNGRHNFPRFTRERTTPGPRRFVTTLRYVHARDGQFTYEDHGTPWSTVARNLDVVVRKDTEYTGTASFSNGTVQIQDFLPMQVDMRSQFTVDGALVRFSDLDLVADGSVSDITGVVDLGRWPEQTWHVRSKVDFPRMRQLFFAREPWRLSGTGEFTGTFHLFKGGRELTGTFASDLAGVNEYRFQDLRGALLWLPDRLEVTDARARVYGGAARFEYRMAPLGAPTPATARFAATYADVDLATFTRAIEMEGIRFAGRATGRNLLEWPLGRFAQARGDGHVRVRPPEGTELLDPAAVTADLNDDAQFGEEWGPFASHAPLGYVPIGADFAYRFDPEWVTLAPGWFATRRTHVTFDGRTAYGERSTIPFQVASSDWQESDRLLAGILTAFGSPTGAVPVGGWGTFDGLMLGAFRDPRIEGRFSGERMRAWGVVWGTGEAEIAIEDGYVDVARSRVTHGGASIEAEGRFSLGYPRRDGGEEINARVRLTDDRCSTCAAPSGWKTTRCSAACRESSTSTASTKRRTGSASCASTRAPRGANPSRPPPRHSGSKVPACAWTAWRRARPTARSPAPPTSPGRVPTRSTPRDGASRSRASISCSTRRRRSQGCCSSRPRGAAGSPNRDSTCGSTSPTCMCSTRASARSRAASASATRS
jgi:hypothetical protein